MALTPGTRLGPYEISARLGVGGMGEVYRARDMKLNRDVAIKILSPSFVVDRERLARFEREARVLASLNHPNIAHIYELGQDGEDGPNTVPFIVMELIDGETLGRKLEALKSKGLRINESIAIAKQVAEALDAAHERGIVHRDLKPENIAITPDGTVKVLDFGLAKSDGTGEVGRAGAGDVTNSPTVMGPTVAGVLLGTAPYMSPEQARGKAVDKRADIWAFGCVLYEMLTGRRAFSGETTSDTLAAILERDVDWSALPTSVPRSVRRLLERSLAKNPKQRLRDIGDARLELEAAVEKTDTTAPTWTLPAIAWPLVIGALGAAAFGAWLLRSRQAPSLPPWEREAAVFSISAPVTMSGAVGLPTPGIAISPDEKYIAWTAGPPDQPASIWLYTVGTGITRELPGTAGATSPFWSPDGRSLAFQAQGAVRIIDLANEHTRSIAESTQVAPGGTWNADNTIVFSARYSLMAVPASGGAQRVVAQLDRSLQENSVRYPRFLPDGRHFLYVARSGHPPQSGAYVGSLDGKAVRLFSTTSHVAYVDPGYLVYASDGALIARTFDLATMKVGSDQITIVDKVGANAGGMNGHFDVSPHGLLAYLEHSTTPKAKLQWFDRTGRLLGAIGETAEYQNFRIAPDDARVAVDLANDRMIGRDVWVLNTDAPPKRVTFGGSDDWLPFWAADGQAVGFQSYRNGVADLYLKRVDGSGPEEPLILSETQKTPGSWSADGRVLSYWNEQPDTKGDVLVLPSGKDATPIAVARTKFDERSPRTSPDGRFVAYESDEGGDFDVYVQPIPPTGGKWQVSIGGGREVAWRADGRELFYVNNQGMLVAVPVTLSAAGFSSGTPVPLFAISRRWAGGITRYDAAGDGRRFLVRQQIDPPPQPLKVVLNWIAGIHQR